MLFEVRIGETYGLARTDCWVKITVWWKLTFIAIRNGCWSQIWFSTDQKDKISFTGLRAGASHLGEKLESEPQRVQVPFHHLLCFHEGMWQFSTQLQITLELSRGYQASYDWVSKEMSFLLNNRRFQSTAAKLRNIILLVKDVKVSAHFYRTAIGVPVLGQTDEMVQLNTGGTSVILKVQF